MLSTCVNIKEVQILPPFNMLWEHPHDSNRFITQHISFLCHPTYPVTVFAHSSYLSPVSAPRSEPGSNRFSSQRFFFLSLLIILLQ